MNKIIFLLNLIIINVHSKDSHIVQCTKLYQIAVNNVLTFVVNAEIHGKDFDNDVILNSIKSLGDVFKSCHKVDFPEKRVENCFLEIKKLSPKLQRVIKAISNGDVNMAMAEAASLSILLPRTINKCKK